MGCYHPLSAVITDLQSPRDDGKSRTVRVIGAYHGNVPALLPNEQHVLLPCGQCIFCRLRRSLEWTIRCYHEQSRLGPGSFVTLTFDDDHVPRLPDGQLTLNYRPFQLFMKRLRKAYSHVTFRFVMCGEYGSRTQRPHYHAMLFGFRFPDSRPFGKYYRSATLERLWPLGHSLIGDLVPGSINYVCRYNLKKITGAKADEWYKGRVPEFIRCSNRPGIGADWLDSFYSDIYKVDLFTEAVLRDSARFLGRDCRPPKYYDKLIKLDKPGLWDAIASARAAFADSQPLPTVQDLRNAEAHAQAVAKYNLELKRLKRIHSSSPHI